MKAVVIESKGIARVLDNVKEPSPPPQYVKVKVVAVALNPTDWKSVHGEPKAGAIVGCDFSGIVEEIGSDVKSDVKKGDRIFGFVQGCNNINLAGGAFAEYLLAKDGIFAKVPDFMSMEDAATLGVGVVTVGQAFYQSLKLPLPTKPAEKPFPILIYGGSTATGTLAIQYAKLSGLEVLSTSSPSNFGLLKSRGADTIFNYNEPEIGTKIRDFTKNNLTYILDTISLPDSVKICAEALSTVPDAKLNFTALLSVKDFPRKDVEVGFTFGYTALGEPIDRWGVKLDPIPENYEHAKMFFKLTEKLLEERKIVPHPATVGADGLNGVLDGFEQMREDKVRGTKLVYRVADTL